MKVKLLSYLPDKKTFNSLRERGLRDQEWLKHATFTFSIEGISRVCCYDPKTEVLTASGWKRFPDVNNTDLFCTLNPNTHEIEYQRAIHFFAEPYKGKLYAIRSTKVDLLVTPNHRMYIYPFDTQRAKRAKRAGKDIPSLWEIRRAGDIVGKRVAYKKTGLWNHPDLTAVEIPVTQVPCYGGMRKVDPLVLDTNLFVEFLGYYFSEGSLHHSKGTGYNIVLHQKLGDVRDRMYEVIKALGFHPRYLANRKRVGGVVFSSYQLYQYLAPLGKTQDKHIPREFLVQLSRRQCDILLQALITGDGSRYFKRGPWRYHTVSKRLADDVQELALKAGYAADISVIDRTGHSHAGPRGVKIRWNYPSYVVTILTRQNVPLVNHRKKQHDRWVRYDGMAYCVEVPNGLLYVRRNYKAVWCGNSHQLVRHRMASYLQQSQRYVKLDRDGFVTPPKISANEPARKMYDELMRTIWEKYEKLLEAGVPVEDARFVLPNAAKTNIVVTINANSLFNFFELRCCLHSQWEIRKLANEMLREVKRVAPSIFADAGPWCKTMGVCPEKDSSCVFYSKYVGKR